MQNKYDIKLGKHITNSVYYLPVFTKYILNTIYHTRMVQNSSFPSNLQGTINTFILIGIIFILQSISTSLLKVINFLVVLKSFGKPFQMLG